MIEVKAARPQHVGPIATRMREIDREECASSGMSGKDALRYGLLYSETAWTVLVDGRPEAMFGVVPVSLLEGRGHVWLLMTDDAMKQHRAIVRLGKRYTEALHRHYRILSNRVHARNDPAIRWLTHLGFFVGAVDVIRGRPMRDFTRIG